MSTTSSTPRTTGLDDTTWYALTRSPQAAAERGHQVRRGTTTSLALVAAAFWTYDVARVVLG